MNRFTWDMRYPNARDFPGHDHVGGEHARPGRRRPGATRCGLTAGGVTKTQDFEIRRNAAVAGVTDADLQAQFALASRSATG